MPGSKGLSPHELAHPWVKGLGTRPDISIKVGCISHDMRILGGLWECAARNHPQASWLGTFVPNIII